ncbi:hypothetical protein F4778DRAFT_289975 [Xylariomycetidae sp. FL2044]|nr:hypothetical protein F4778DRAFT_289975 [Xylariomycetidae sp. FL2044]
MYEVWRSCKSVIVPDMTAERRQYGYQNQIKLKKIDGIPLRPPSASCLVDLHATMGPSLPIFLLLRDGFERVDPVQRFIKTSTLDPCWTPDQKQAKSCRPLQSLGMSRQMPFFYHPPAFPHHLPCSEKQSQSAFPVCLCRNLGEFYFIMSGNIAGSSSSIRSGTKPAHCTTTPPTPSRKSQVKTPRTPGWRQRPQPPQQRSNSFGSCNASKTLYRRLESVINASG